MFTKAEKRILAGLVLIYAAWKLYKFTLMLRYGPFSSEFLGASVAAGMGIVVLGVLLFYVLHWFQGKASSRRS